LTWIRCPIKHIDDQQEVSGNNTAGVININLRDGDRLTICMLLEIDWANKMSGDRIGLAVAANVRTSGLCDARGHRASH